MNWFKRIKDVLQSEPELWLAYLHGQQYENLTHLSKDKKKYSGFFTRFAIWVIILLRQTRLNFKPKNKKSKFLVYAGTVNQKNSLQRTVLTLREKGQIVCAVAPKNILNENEIKDAAFCIKTYGAWEVLKSFLFIFIRFNALRKQLKGKNSKLIDNDFNVFLNVYDELVYFEKLLKEVEPKYVIVSNDHNAANRALLALARKSNIKTVYMQHASVSELFPAINVDYAFLDGLSALKVYRKCEGNLFDEQLRLENRQVFLSGQKKKLKKVVNVNKKKVGVAMNGLDSVEDTVNLISCLSTSESMLKIRWHPGLSQRVIKELLNRLSRYDLEFSDPKVDSLEDFFSDLKCLISGNSSIHLEAALSNTIPIYYEVTPTNTPDYYDYVKNGLAFHAKGISALEDLILFSKEGKLKLNESSIKFYSWTYGTEWESKEDELTVEVLISLLTNNSPPIKAYKV